MFIELKDTNKVCIDLSKVYAFCKTGTATLRFRFQGKSDHYDREYASIKERDEDYKRIISFLQKVNLLI